MHIFAKALATIVAILFFASPSYAAETPTQGDFFSDTWRQVTDMVSPSDSSNETKTPRHLNDQTITIKDGAVGVDAANVATHVTIGSDDTVILQTDDGHSVAPSVEPSPAEKTDVVPEEKEDAPAAKESSMWDDMLDSVGLAEDKEAAK